MDFLRSPPGEEPIVVEGYFAASPARVFRAWTEPAMVMKWFGQRANSLQAADIDLRPGGAWRFTMSVAAEKSVGFEGQYLEVEPGARLVFSWAHVVIHADGAREATPDSRVEVSFTARGGGTLVRLVHAAVRSEDARRGIGGGWEAAFGSLGGVLAETETSEIENEAPR